jgi:hypothetical protein
MIREVRFVYTCEDVVGMVLALFLLSLFLY